MGYLSGKSVYLCGPISADSKDGVIWRDEISPRLSDLGILIKDPCKKKGVLGEIGDDKAKFKELIKQRNWLELKKAFYPVMKSDLRMVDLSDFLIMEYIPKVATWGSPHEVVIARNIQHKPVLVHCAEENLDDFNPWVLGLIKSQWLFTSWDDMIEYLKVIDSGKLDSSHWT